MALLWQWFLKAWRPHYRNAIRPTLVLTFGFRKRHCTGDITNLLREFLVKSTVWGRPIIIGSMDIKFAFDNMNHQVLRQALQKSGMPTDMVYNLMRALSRKTACINLSGAGRSGDFRLLRGGKQGGIETPDEFNVLMEYALDGLVDFWNDFGLGFVLDNVIFNHATWAVNIILAASDIETFQVMTQQLTEAIYKVDLSWKPSSLEMLAGGSLIDGKLQCSMVLPCGRRWP